MSLSGDPEILWNESRFMRVRGHVEEAADLLGRGLLERFGKHLDTGEGTLLIHPFVDVFEDGFGGIGQ